MEMLSKKLHYITTSRDNFPRVSYVSPIFGVKESKAFHFEVSLKTYLYSRQPGKTEMVFASLGQQFCFLRWQGWPGFQYFPSKIEYFLKLCIGLWHLRTRENQCEHEARISCAVNNDILCLFPGVMNHLLVSLKLWLTNLLFYTEGTIADPSQVQHALPFDHLGQTAIVLINQNYQMKFWISSWSSVENGAHCPPGCSKPSCQSKQTWENPGLWHSNTQSGMPTAH